MTSHCSIIGMDAVTALGASADATWREMLRGTCGIRQMRRFDPGLYMTAVAGEIPPEIDAACGEPDCPGEFGRCFLLAHHAAANAIRNATGSLGVVSGGRTALVLATAKAGLAEFERAIEQGRQTGPGHFNAFAMAEDLARALGIGGPVLAVSNACASGLAAIIQAALLLERGDADVAVVAGADVLARFTLAGFSCLGALSARPCRPYDASRDGLSLGEAAAAMVLVREPPRGAGLACVRGWAMTNDASHITSPLHTGDGLRRAIAAALQAAGTGASDVDFINGHGTGTVQNDEMEAQAINAIFGGNTPPVSSMKGYFGHTLGAAGVVEAVLCVMAMRDSMVPASLGFRGLGVSKPLNIAASHSRLPSLETVLTVKCGFGGINAAVVLGKQD